MENETEYVRRLQEVDDRSRRNEGRIKKLEADQKALLELTSSVRELANEQGHVKQDLAEIKEDVKGLAARQALGQHCEHAAGGSGGGLCRLAHQRRRDVREEREHEQGY